MYKAKSASMMRGTAYSDRKAITKRELGQFKKTVISKQELAQFSHGAKTRDALLDELEPVVRSLAKNGFRSPKDVSRLLNKQGLRTATGEQWNPQLTWFLLDFLFRRRDQRRKQAAQKRTAPPMAKSVPAPSTQKASPLTREEMARRLAALGRVTAGDSQS
ncbi:hypothetical protein [Caulobacter sp. CCH9-E1]|uniref:hypothetical protein n=1 Tax=Caulobacter sp. CCH9-E1 TaxID=1768768 RepID=UPI0008358083|nr:hypothetical protein [Caulobacter sp. CCH9-E1]